VACCSPLRGHGLVVRRERRRELFVLAQRRHHRLVRRLSILAVLKHLLVRLGERNRRRLVLLARLPRQRVAAAGTRALWSETSERGISSDVASHSARSRYALIIERNGAKRWRTSSMAACFRCTSERAAFISRSLTLRFAMALSLTSGLSYSAK